MVSRSTVLGLAAVGLTISGLFYEAGKSEQANLTRANKLIPLVKIQYDSNKDGILQFDEGRKLARDLGYNEMFPCEQVAFNLRPSPYESYVDLNVFSLGNEPCPAYNQHLQVSIDGLEKLAKK